MKKQTQIAIEISKLAQVIQKKIPLEQFDAEPVYIPQLHQALQLLKLAAQSIPTSPDGWFFSMQQDFFTKAKNSAQEMTTMLSYLQSSLTQNGHRYTFWHSAAMVLLTSLLYAKCLQERRHEHVNLADENTLKAMEWDACVLIINHLSNRLYEKPLKAIHEIVSSEKFDIQVIFAFFRKQIEKCNQTAVTVV